MTPEEFERIAADSFGRVPERFRARIKNVALLVEDRPDEETRKEEGLADDETLLGLYRGVPQTARGDFYSGVLPDTITLYRLPLLEEAEEVSRETGRPFPECVREAVEETVWHEVAHYFGMDEPEVDERERERTNRFKP
ncbi:MAG: metallopeptidase family protein [Patescibacteria group bacterium]|nr:metallopeptidase family protein [Patescibacteria group bacterium]MDE1966197.1 metallopeptidase family protein [Patescibacteria group bacterium]